MKIDKNNLVKISHIVGEVYSDDYGNNFYLCANKSDAYYLINLETGEMFSYPSLDDLDNENRDDIRVSCKLVVTP